MGDCLVKFCKMVTGPMNPNSSDQPIEPNRLRSFMRRFMSWLVIHTSVQTQGTWLARYSTAIAAVALATLLRILLDPLLEQRVPYGIYVIATTIVAWRCGLGPALVTLLLGIILAVILFENDRGIISLVVWDANRAAMVTTLLLGAIIAVLTESLRWIALDNARLCQQARQSEAHKDEFLAMLAHELRNPLASINSALYLLEAAGSPDPQVTELRQTISRQVTHLVRLVDDLLDVSRITQGKIELRCERVELSKIIESALEITHPMIQEKGHQLHLVMSSRRVYLNVDVVRMTQTVANLLNNAAKYTDQGGQIWLTAQATADEVVLRVRDTGIGIAPEMQARVFNMFEQASHAIEHSRGGLGVGLTLVRTLVEMHGGTVAVHSLGLGLGSEFTIRLPVTAIFEDSVPPAAPKLEAAPAPAVTSALPLKILVVDDNLSVATSLAKVLKHWNHKVEFCVDGFAALETARLFLPDVVLTDLGLPQMNGYQLATGLRRLPGMEDAVLIAVSGYGQPADRERSRAAGFSRHLVKPVNLNELETILTEK